MARMATWAQRFEAGDYPMVCARSGLPADTLVAVEAERRAAWPWIFGPFSFMFWIARGSIAHDRLKGKVPFAAGHIGGITAIWDRSEDVVVLRGVHPDFVAACRRHQASRTRP